MHFKCDFKFPNFQFVNFWRMSTLIASINFRRLLKISQSLKYKVSAKSPLRIVFLSRRVNYHQKPGRPNVSRIFDSEQLSEKMCVNKRFSNTFSRRWKSTAWSLAEFIDRTRLGLVRSPDINNDLKYFHIQIFTAHRLKANVSAVFSFPRLNFINKPRKTYSPTMQQHLRF